MSDFQIEHYAQLIRSAANNWQIRSDSANGWKVSEGSALAGDDKQTAPMQTSHVAQGGLLAAIDNLQALTTLTIEHRTMHAFAPATLARAVLECACMTIWLLEPRSRTQRIERTLRWNAKDLRDSSSAHEHMGIPQSPPLRDRLNELRAIATKTGVEPNAAVSKLTSTEAVRAARSHLKSEGSSFDVLTTWQLTSGYAHGRRWAALAFSEREPRDTGDPGTVNLRFTLDYERLLAIAAPGQEALASAIALYDRRAAAPHP